MRALQEYRTAVVAFCAMLIFVSFFHPWIKVHMCLLASFKSLLGGSNSACVTSISGPEIPQMANGSLSKVLITFVGIFTSKVDNADMKSRLVWAIPVLAILVLAASWHYRRNWVAGMLIAILCLFVGIAGLIKLFLADTDTLLFRIQLCPALWITMITFIVIGLVHLVTFPEQIMRVLQAIRLRSRLRQLHRQEASQQ